MFGDESFARAQSYVPTHFPRLNVRQIPQRRQLEDGMRGFDHGLPAFGRRRADLGWQIGQAGVGPFAAQQFFEPRFRMVQQAEPVADAGEVSTLLVPVEMRDKVVVTRLDQVRRQEFLQSALFFAERFVRGRPVQADEVMEPGGVIPGGRAQRMKDTVFRAVIEGGVPPLADGARKERLTV